MKYENALQRAIKGRLERAMELAELFGLLIIGIGTVAAMGVLIWHMVQSDGVTLTDLLLMFLYLEIFAMVGQYLKAGQLPVLIRQRLCSLRVRARFFGVWIPDMHTVWRRESAV